MNTQQWDTKSQAPCQTDIVLVVDDNPNNLNVLSDTLSQAGLDVAIAVDGETALKQLQLVPVSLILLDIRMPGIDGFETCRRLKSNSSTQDIPVIFMTVLSEIDDKVKGFKLGAVDYITKPFQQAEILVRINTHLQVRRLTQTLAIRNQELENLTHNLEERVSVQTAELSKSLKQLQQAQAKLIQAEKMSSLGQLVAGIAHEINNPMNFLHGNLLHIQNHSSTLLDLINLYEDYFPNPPAAFLTAAEKMEIGFLREDLPKILSSMKLGSDRIQQIIFSLKNFSRIDEFPYKTVNLHEGIESTLLILQYRLKAKQRKPAIEVIRNYDELPPVECYPGQINQVFMNILSNAIDAIEESQAKQDPETLEQNPGKITISTRAEITDWVTVEFSDSGSGIPPEVQSRIFDPFFTTKEVGKGTGMGLSISYQIVVDLHHGNIACQSSLGQGTKFTIRLPLQQS